MWLQHDGKWWVASPKHWNFTAASKAVKQVFGVEPDMTREGGRYVNYLSLLSRFDYLHRDTSANIDIAFLLL